MARGNKKNRAPGGSKGQARKGTGDFLEKNRQKEGVIVTASGLQYTVLTEGDDGLKPQAGDTVLVHQRITLRDGKVIADTYHDDEPDRFNFNEALPGYREGLEMMTVGSRYKFFIPPELAWGTRGAGSKIGPNAVVIIDAALLGIDF